MTNQPPSGQCLICDEQQGDLIGHLLILHPDATDGGFLAWPDGSAVVVDSTLEPDDFNGSAA